MNERKLKEKILAQFKEEILDSIKITKKTNKKIQFEIAGISGVYNIVMKQAPQWFQEFEKRNNKRFDDLEEKVDKNSKAIENNYKLIRKYHPE